MKNIVKFKIILIVIVGFIVTISCTNEFDYGKLQNAVRTIASSNIAQTTADISGNVITNNGAGLSARGVCFSTTNNPTISDTKIVFDTATLGNFTCTLDNLLPSTTYNARAYATNSYGTAYGAVIKFTTLVATVPIISSTIAANLITTTTAKTGGTITNSGASNVISRGVCYSSTATNPTIANTKTNDGSGIGTFVSSLIGLTANTTYYIRAYATNGVGTAYGDVKSFTTTTATIPTGITTITASAITQTMASSGGSISNTGGISITSRGVCWSNATSSPTIANTKTIDGTGTGAFASLLTGLTAGTTYYVKAFATNSVGTAYGNTISFTTATATIPVGISTNTLSLVTQTTASGGGNVNNDGGASVNTRGVCWSNTNSNPTIANTKTIDGSGIGAFSSSITGLTAGTTYYVRAYATNTAGTAYGSMKNFTTQSATIPQSIITTTVSSLTQTAANSGGSITSDGGATITMKGVCWSSTTSTPTIINSNTNNGTGIASFSSSFSGLIANTTYYIRAYALNSVGVGYGNTITFTTLPNLAVGQSYQGGKIAYIFVSGDNGYISGQIHGLIAMTSDQSTATQWGCYGTSISGTSTLLGTGYANTTYIVGSCTTTGIAASICNNLVSGGYSDWYLPSSDEMYKLYLNRLIIGGLTGTYYWSSSQYSSTNAYFVDFSTGSTNNTSKSYSSMNVRAIRKF